MELAQAHEYAVALLDVMMPEMDGYSCCQALKAFPTMRETPVVFMTADRSPSLRRMEALGGTFLAKPFDLAPCWMSSPVWRLLAMRDETKSMQAARRIASQFADHVVFGPALTHWTSPDRRMEARRSGGARPHKRGVGMLPTPLFESRTCAARRLAGAPPPMRRAW